MVKYGMIHGDLHDGNILCEDKLLYLLDFGMIITLKLMLKYGWLENLSEAITTCT